MTTAQTPVNGFKEITPTEFLDVNAAQPGRVLGFDGHSVNWAPAPSPQPPAVVPTTEQALGERSASVSSSRSSSPTEWQDAEDTGAQLGAPSATATTTTTASLPQAPVDLTSSWMAAPESFRQQAREREESARRAQGRCTIC